MLAAAAAEGLGLAEDTAIADAAGLGDAAVGATMLPDVAVGTSDAGTAEGSSLVAGGVAPAPDEEQAISRSSEPASPARMPPSLHLLPELLPL